MQRRDDGTRVFVGVVHWDGAHNPRIEWAYACCAPPESSETTLDGVVTEVLCSLEYFAVCGECGQRNPIGWMHDDSICQSCAERNHGVVY